MKLKSALVHTLKTVYDQDSVIVRTPRGKIYRLHIYQIAKMMDHFDFKVEKAHKYEYLIVNKFLEIKEEEDKVLKQIIVKLNVCSALNKRELKIVQNILA